MAKSIIGCLYHGFLRKNQHTQRKLLYLEFWINGDPSEKRHNFSNKAIEIDFIKKCSRKLVFLNNKKKKLERFG